MLRHLFSLLVFIMVISPDGYTQDSTELLTKINTINPVDVVYKKIDTVVLKLSVYYPTDFTQTKSYPAIIFFFGGGWLSGSRSQFDPQAKYFSSRGMIAVTADYRVQGRHGTNPFDAVTDAKTAIRFLREHATILNINPGKIVGSGGSAGGHLAAVAGFIVGFNAEGEDTSISSKPNALVLFNPVIDNSPEGYGFDRIGDRYTEISPIHNIVKGAPPTILFFGTNDYLVPVSTAQKFKQKMEDVGSRCDLFLYDGQPHGFFNYSNLPYFKQTVRQADIFLKSLGYLKGKPTI
jgi:acetyl esterase